MNQEGLIISYLSDSPGGIFTATAHLEVLFSCYLHIFFTSRTWKNHEWKLFAYGKIFAHGNIKNRKNFWVKKKKEKKQKSRPYEERKSTILSRKEKRLRWKRLVLTKLHAGFHILNTGVPSKQNLPYIKFKSRFPTTHASNWPWYKNINNRPELYLWKLSSDSLSWFSAHFPVFPF